ncbi:hypothetical protein ISN76_10750 [Dyella halodurans]|uniref:Uncharacterized protein n=1 Tax=Dyella halodurans TaxID=1920171 RepID=A0ABV9C2C6_9GAMM|nr:hypothetical protein [Dyella halodurans]
MNELLELAVEAHGGLKRWQALRHVAAELSVGGVIWELKGQPGLFSNANYSADLQVQRATLGRFGNTDRLVQFSPDKLVLETSAGHVLEERAHPREAFAGHDNETPWDPLHAAYFNSYALWTYLTQPFLYTYPGFQVAEIEPWQEDGETWRRLKVLFPGTVASHTREQVSYFGPDGLMRRHDYAVDILGGAQGAHYMDDYRDVDGLRIPHRRRVYPLGAGNERVAEPLLVTIDISAVSFT